VLFSAFPPLSPHLYLPHTRSVYITPLPLTFGSLRFLAFARIRALLLPFATFCRHVYRLVPVTDIRSGYRYLTVCTHLTFTAHYPTTALLLLRFARYDAWFTLPSPHRSLRNVLPLRIHLVALPAFAARLPTHSSGLNNPIFTHRTHAARSHVIPHRVLHAHTACLRLHTTRYLRVAICGPPHHHRLYRHYHYGRVRAVGWDYLPHTCAVPHCRLRAFGYTRTRAQPPHSTTTHLFCGSPSYYYSRAPAQLPAGCHQDRYTLPTPTPRFPLRFCCRVLPFTRWFLVGVRCLPHLPPPTFPTRTTSHRCLRFSFCGSTFAGRIDDYTRFTVAGIYHTPVTFSVAVAFSPTPTPHHDFAPHRLVVTLLLHLSVHTFVTR